MKKGNPPRPGWLARVFGRNASKQRREKGEALRLMPGKAFGATHYEEGMAALNRAAWASKSRRLETLREAGKQLTAAEQAELAEANFRLRVMDNVRK